MRVAVGNVVWREVNAAHARSMRELAVSFARSKEDSMLDVTVPGDALVSRSRSIVASHFLRTNCDVLLSIDSDIVFDPDDAIKLAHAAVKYDIVGGMYMTRKISTQPALMLPADRPVSFEADAEPVEVPYASTGFLAISRRVFNRLRETLPLCHKGWTSDGFDTSFWPFYMPFIIPSETEENIYLSEDWAFCQRAKDVGFSCWLDPSIRLTHVGTYNYTMEDLMRPPKSDAKALRLTRAWDGSLETQDLTEKGYVNV